MAPSTSVFYCVFSLSQFTKGIAEDLVAKRLVAICRSSNSFLLVFAYPVSNVPIIFALLRRGPPTIPHRHQNSCLFVRHSVALFSSAPYSMYSATGVSFGRTPLAGRLVRSEPPPVLRPRATSACSVQLHRLPASPARRRCKRAYKLPGSSLAPKAVVAVTDALPVHFVPHTQPPFPNCCLCARKTIAAHWWPASLYKIHKLHPFQERPSYACFEMSLFLSV